MSERWHELARIQQAIKRAPKNGAARASHLIEHGVHPATEHPLFDGDGDGKTCGDCQFSIKVHGGARHYWKCEKRGITHGEATDIRISWPACTLHQPAQEPRP